MTATRKRYLGEFIKLDIDPVEVVATAEYRIAGVYGFGRGVFERGPINGTETSYVRLNRLHSGQLVVSRLKAFEGALGVVPEKLDGWFLSAEFPTFRCIEEELDPQYLAHLCRWREFWQMIATTSKGIGARRERVHANDLLNIKLAVPSLEEQRRVADRLDRLQAVAGQLAQRSENASELTTALAVSASARPDLTDTEKTRAGWRRVRLGSVMALADHRVPVEVDGFYPNIGIYSFGRGLFSKPDIEGATTSANSLTRICAGQFIYSRLFAFEGAYSYVPAEYDGFFVSNEFPTFNVDPHQLEARWLANYLRSPDRWLELAAGSKGIGVRRQRVPVDAVLAYEVWLPPLAEQQAVVAAIDRLDRVHVGRARAMNRMASLVPAALNQAFADLS